MQSEISSCSTDSMNIMSRSLTIAPLITMISSPLIIPVSELIQTRQHRRKYTSSTRFGSPLVFLPSGQTFAIIVIHAADFDTFQGVRRR